ncbi:ABC transporter substrate-binding protein [Thiotrichales bacterium 19S11-10]|nr:ABC transporter substrate-binding protein [Thiotrichales bacterium 19S11-10]MCF6806814.1 ABC transporter substrate-binding protein [Thiotrichales bacterium 19S9-11]MCF6810783.1 ABC transporter substrate-binding protein [Thiotrichales bacterium 19S9-12]
MKSKQKIAIILIISLLLFGNRLYSFNVITLAPSITYLVQDIIDQANTDGLASNVKIIATTYDRDNSISTKLYPSVGDGYNIRTNKIILLKPDLIIAWHDKTPKSVINKLIKSNIKLIEVNAASIDEVTDLIRQLGILIGLEKSAQQLVSKFKQRLKELKPKNITSKKIFVQLTEIPLYTIGSKALISEIITFCGGRNIYNGKNSYVFEVSKESVIKKNPDIILVIQRLSKGSRRLTSTTWQNYSQINAVKNKNIYSVDSESVSQPTFLLLNGIRSVCQIIQTV